MVNCGTLGSGLLLALLLGICRLQAAEGIFRGDPVQMFKRMRFGEQRSMWSDVLVGQAPLFQVDRASQLHLPTRDYINSHTAIKLQLSYDHEKLTSEWLTLSDGKGLLLDTLTVIFVYSGSDIKEVHHQQHFLKSPEDSEPPPHQKQITIAYRWIEDEETDTREGLNFLFVGGFCLTILAVLGVLFDSQDLLSTRALLVPEYEDTGRKKPTIKSFVLFQAEELHLGNEVPLDEEGGGESKVKAPDAAGIRLRAGGAQEDPESEGGSGVGGGDSADGKKGD